MEGSSSRQLKKVDIPCYRTERIKQICTVMPSEYRSAFEKSHGRILDLLIINMDPIFVRVLIHFWNSEMRCFEFPQFDLVPTLEEYELMIRWHKSTGIYLPRESRISVSRVASLIRLSVQHSALVGKGAIQGWNISMLENHLSFLAHEGDWSSFSKTLALLVFGMFLFPFHTDTVDHAAMDAFFAWDVHSKSPIPALLADTLLSVEFCQRKQGKTLKCSSVMLYVWGITPFYASGHMGASPDPLRSFSKILLCHRQAMEWKVELKHWGVEHLSWFCLGSGPAQFLSDAEITRVYRFWASEAA